MTTFNFEFERGGRLQQKGRIMKILGNSKKQIVAEFCPEVCLPSNLKYFLERLFSNSNTSISFLTLFDTKLEIKRLMVLLSFISIHNRQQTVRIMRVLCIFYSAKTVLFAGDQSLHVNYLLN